MSDPRTGGPTMDHSGESTPIDPDLIIATFPFLKGMAHEELIHFFRHAIQRLTCAPNTVLYRQDTPVDYIYVLLEGEGEQKRDDRDGQGRKLRTLQRTVGPGALIGLFDYIFAEQNGNLYRTSARTSSHCSVMVVNVAAFNRLFYRYPKLRRELFPLARINRLRTIPLLRGMDNVMLGFLADAMDEREYELGAVVYHDGEGDDNLYIIDYGQVKLEWDDQTRWFGNGSAFCAAMHNDERELVSTAHSAVITTPTAILVIPRTVFKAITSWDPVKRIEAQTAKRDRALELLFRELFKEQGFTSNQRNLLAGYMSYYYFPIDSVIVYQGEEANSLWLLMEDGQAAIHALDELGEKLQTTISEGPAYFAETALLGQVLQDSTVEALAGSEWLRLYWHDFQDYDEAEPVDMRSLLLVDPPKGHVITGSSEREKYPWLQRGELVVLFSRRHWIAYLRKGIPSFIAFAVLLVLTFFGSLIPGLQWWIAIPLGMATLVALLLFVWGTIDYFNDWIIITNRRVVHQEKVLFINEWRKEAPLEQIQNVNFQTTFVGRWFNYGTMVIQTASTSGVIEFEYTTHFKRLYDAISEQRRRRQRHTDAQKKMAIQQMLERRLGLHLVLPKEVYHGGREDADGETGWRQRAGELMMPTLRREEDDRIIWRRHWMVLLPQLWWAVLILLFWIVIGVLVGVFSVTINTVVDLRGVVFLLESIIILSLLVALLRLLWVIVDWHNDTYEVSVDSLVHVTKKPLAIAEDRKSASLGNIQNVEMYINDPIQWVFNFGDVVCQTAAEEGDFTFKGVPDPRSVTDEILRRIESFRRRQDDRAARDRARDLPDWFEVYKRMGADELEEDALFQ